MLIVWTIVPTEAAYEYCTFGRRIHRSRQEKALAGTGISARRERKTGRCAGLERFVQLHRAPQRNVFASRWGSAVGALKRRTQLQNCGPYNFHFWEGEYDSREDHSSFSSKTSAFVGAVGGENQV